MGYSTYYDGVIQLEPPLPAEALLEWKTIYDTYDNTELRLDPKAPNSYLQWVPSPDGASVAHDGNEKFYDGPSWMKYVIERWVKPSSCVANGILLAQGEETGDVWRLIVRDNEVFTQHFDFTVKTEQVARPEKRV